MACETQSRAAPAAAPQPGKRHALQGVPTYDLGTVEISRG
jgi:hypothetical protein